MDRLVRLTREKPQHDHADGACASKQNLADTPDDAPLKVHRRFDRFARLVGDRGVDRLAKAHVMVVGCGGVGSWAAESLARSAVGRITLVDFDLVCITNTNRQLHAMKGTVGKQKVEVMAERLRLIHPSGRIDAVAKFYEAHARDELLADAPDFIIDAIDNVTAKLDLLATCLARKIPVITTMGAAGRMDPTKVRIDDLAFTVRDGLAKDVRKHLVRKHAVEVAEDGSLGVPAVFSEENMLPPAEVSADTQGGFACVCPHGDNHKHSCEKRARIDGTASFVTGAFGLAAASYVVRALAHPESAKRITTTVRKGTARRKRPVG